MRLNGLWVVADLAMRELQSPVVGRYQKALVLGSLREDVWYVPAVGRVIEHLSFSHFYRPGLPGGLVPMLWPGPRRKARVFYDRAVDEYRAGRRASGFVQLGRVVHLLTDMSCPVHAHRTVHETDPFEWWVEGNKKRLAAMRVPRAPAARVVEDVIEGMAVYTQRYRTDETNHLPGRLLRKAGLLRPVAAREAGAQGRALIPMAAGYTVELLRLFLREVGEETAPCSRGPTPS